MKKVLYNGENSVIYLDKVDGKDVAVKILRSEFPTAEEILNFNNELFYTSEMNHQGIRKVIRAEQEDGKHTLTLKYINGDSFYNAFVAERKPLEKILSAFIKIADALAYVHSKGIVHKDINDNNILWKDDEDQPVIIDFGISNQLDIKSHNLGNPDKLLGTLAFMPPEQTGRVNRKIDHRSDLYSLGVLLYRVLTGVLPFESVDSLEMVHFQIAKTAIPVVQINHKVPRVISDITIKLMEKNAEDRYQSAQGLKKDLELCLSALKREGKLESFTIGKKDFSESFEIPQKLYGRENEIATLLKSFSRISRGGSELFLVAGYSGVGKSSLINELFKPITEKRAFFVEGKFDQYQHNVPFYAISQAFSQFSSLLLTEKTEKLEKWKNDFNTALGGNGQILIDFVPDLEKVIGPQPPAVSLEPQEAQNRFVLVFQEFIKTICKAEHPFVLFVDDLQWADIGSLNFIKKMITDINTPYFMIIGAYRDNEIGPGHSLPKIIEDAKNSGAIIKTIDLKPLTKKDVTHLVSDTLKIEDENTNKIASLVYSKTEGNAFFTIEYLKSLYQQGAFNFSAETGKWVIDFKALKNLDVSDNVVELMMGKIEELDKINQNVIKLASCIGGLFSLNLLSVINKKSLVETKRELWPAIEVGLIAPVGDAYQYVEIDETLEPKIEFEFLHDRIQQAAYSLFDKEERKKVHYKIGQLLLKELDSNKDILFDVVNQLNAGRGLIKTKKERLVLVKLNLKCAQVARKGSAFESAKTYMHIATELIEGNLWVKEYELAKEIYTIEADLEFLTGNVDDALLLLENLITKVKSTLEKANIYTMLMRNKSLSNKYLESIESGYEALEMLGFDMPTSKHETHIPAEMQKVVEHITSMGIENIHKMNTISDPKLQATMKILDNFSEPSYVSGNNNLWILHVLYKVNLTFENGLTAEGAYSLVELGLIFFILNNYNFAYPAAQESVKVVELFRKTSPKHISRVGHLFTNYNTPWVKPISETFSLNAKYFKQSVDTGEMIFAGYTSWFPYCNRHFWGNGSAFDLLEKIDDEIAFNKKIKHFLAHNSLLGLKLILKNVTGNTRGPNNYDLKGLKQDEFINSCLSVSDVYSITVFKVMKALNAFMHENYKLALEACNEVLEYAAVIMGMASADGIFKFVHALTLIAIEKDAKEPNAKNLEVIEAYLAQYKIWSDNNPSSFEHKYLLIKAELASLNGIDEDAINLYHEAIESSGKYEFLRESALAHQLAGNFWNKKNNSIYTRPHVTAAKYLYGNIGYNRMVEFIDKKYPFLSQAGSKQTFGGNKTITLGTRSSTSTMVSDNLDFMSILKSSQILSGEILLDKLLEKMLDIVIESAGGQSAALILQKDRKWFVEAEYNVQDDSINVLQDKSIDSVDNLPISVVNYVIRSGKELLSTDKSNMRIFTRDAYLLKEKPASFFCIPLIYKGMTCGILYVEHKMSEAVFTDERMTVIRFLSSQMAVSLDNAGLYNNLSQLNKVYQRFVPYEFIHALGHESILDISLGDQIHQDMNVMFCDIRSFSTLSEGMTPEESFNFINAYLKRIGPIIRNNGGFINHYFGDGFIALFKDSSKDAVQAALEIFKEIDIYNAKRIKNKRQPIYLGIGIHTGEVMMGIIGDEERNDANVISDSVNTASRLEGLTKIFSSKIIISRATLENTEREMDLQSRYFGSLKVKGKEDVLQVYEVLDADGKKLLKTKNKILKPYTQALEDYYNKKFSKAAHGFMKVLKHLPDDYAAKMYFNNCADIIKNGMPQNWDGVEVMTEK